jgi:uncharacterized membrane protein
MVNLLLLFEGDPIVARHKELIYIIFLLGNLIVAILFSIFNNVAEDPLDLAKMGFCNLLFCIL